MIEFLNGLIININDEEKQNLLEVLNSSYYCNIYDDIYFNDGSVACNCYDDMFNEIFFKNKGNKYFTYDNLNDDALQEIENDIMDNLEHNYLNIKNDDIFILKNGIIFDIKHNKIICLSKKDITNLWYLIKYFEQLQYDVLEENNYKLLFDKYNN